MTATDQPQLRNTEELVMEVLVARRRLGEAFWTFDRKSIKAIRRLSEIGYVTYEDHTPVHSGVRVWLTDAGFRAQSVDDYDPLKYMREDLEALRRHASRLEQQTRHAVAQRDALTESLIAARGAAGQTPQRSALARRASRAPSRRWRA